MYCCSSNCCASELAQGPRASLPHKRDSLGHKLGTCRKCRRIKHFVNGLGPCIFVTSLSLGLWCGCAMSIVAADTGRGFDRPRRADRVGRNRRDSRAADARRAEPPISRPPCARRRANTRSIALSQVDRVPFHWKLARLVDDAVGRRRGQHVDFCFVAYGQLQTVLEEDLFGALAGARFGGAPPTGRPWHVLWARRNCRLVT